MASERECSKKTGPFSHVIFELRLHLERGGLKAGRRESGLVKRRRKERKERKKERKKKWKTT